VTVGTRPEIDLAQARTDVASSNVQVINAENAYSLSRAQLARAMGSADLALDFDVADDELAPVLGEEGTSAELAARAYGTRPDLVALEKQRESQELTVKGLKGGYGPTLSASAGFQERGTALSDLGPAWNVGLTLAWPIFQGGTTVGQVREAEANLEVTSAQLDAQKLQISVDVQQAKLSLSAAKATVTAAEEVVSAAREQLRLAEGRYAQGVGNVIELGDAQIAVTSAQAQLVQARFNVSAARADLLAALGRQ
jgi:outer membrane protein